VDKCGVVINNFLSFGQLWRHLVQTLVTWPLLQPILYLYLKAIMETELFICRGLFWTSAEQESYRFSIQCHEQPNVLGINNELLGILIKVKVSLSFVFPETMLVTYIHTDDPLLKVSGHCSANGTNWGHR